MPNDPSTSPRSGRDDELVAADDQVIGRAFWWSIGVIAIVGIAVGGGLWLTRERTIEPVINDVDVIPPDRLATAGTEMPNTLTFTDVTSASGITFTHANGAVGGKLLPETMGGGVAFFDHDGDGDADLLLVNSMYWPDDPRAATQPTMALYENDGAGRFTDITPGSGLDVSFYGMGAAVGDYDADGRPDLFISSLHENHLYRNLGAGRFEDVTAAAGVAGGDDRWSSSAGFADLDGDDDLDLFVCNYVKWTREFDERFPFSLNGTDRAYGPPTQFEGQYAYLYRNDGDGTFTDVSESSGIRRNNPATGQAIGKSLALTFADLDRDDDLDILVANDTVQNFLFRNDGDLTFTDLGASSAVAFDVNGNSTGAMGIDAADFTNAGFTGIAVGNFAGENTSFYVQQTAPFLFAEMSNLEGIGSPSRGRLTFGLFFFDADLDGRLDLLQTNGHLEDEINQIEPSQHYRQRAQLFWNCGPDADACFSVVPDDRVGGLATPIVGRGAAFADIDADGDLDVLLTQTGGAPLLLRNDAAADHHWLRVHLDGATGNPDAIGATVELTAGGITQRRQVMPTRSYLSQSEAIVTFGLGAADAIESVRVRWPDGAEQTVDAPAADRVLVVRRADADG